MKYMIENQKVVTATYKLYIGGEENGQEELFEQATEQRPLTYCHGEGMMLPAFEAQMAGKEAGQTFDFVIRHEDAYGEYDERGVQVLNKTIFFNGDGEFDSERVFPGNVIPMNTTDGQIVNAFVLEVTDKEVTIDLNHPLAGEDLHFVGNILEVRDVTPEELEQIRHPHHCCGKRGKCGNKKSDCHNGDCSDKNSNCHNGGCGGCD